MKITTKGLFKSIEQFSITEKELGHGSFGFVHLAIHKLTGKLYAIKIIDRQNMPSDTEIKLIQREIRIHSEVNHPQCIALWDTISDKQHVYMILQYAEKGNLFYYQNTRQTFSEPQAALLFSQTAKALQYLHELDIMHRDLKPENLLLDSFYNIKLCDFGWSAEDITSTRSTFCGTYQYMAPEMLFAGSYDYRVDIWALGILLYELVQGYAPFRGESVNEVKDSMLQGSYEMSDNFSGSLKELITGILKFEPQQRLTIKQILNSKWLRNMQQIIVDCSTKLILDNSHMSLHQALHLFQVQAKDNKGFKKPKENSKNISFNLSINNFACIRNNQRTNFASPGEAYIQKKKKKEEKRFRHHAEEQLIKLAHSLSPQLKNNSTSQSKQMLSKRQKQQKSKNIQRRRRKKSVQTIEKNPFKIYQLSTISGKTASKPTSILKKKSLHEKLSSVVGSSKNLHKIKTGKRTTQFSNMSTFNY